MLHIMDRYYYWATLITADTMRDREQAAAVRRLARRQQSDAVRAHRNLLADVLHRIAAVHSNHAAKVASSQLG
jgi:hypothetical protein